MKKTVAIFFFCLYLLGTTEAHQLLKLPLLVEHYFKHKAENSNTSLLGFLKMHYADPIVFDEDYAQDMQLPFKSHSEELCLSAIPTLPTPKLEIDIIDFDLEPTNKPLAYNNQYSFLSTQDIFQPPKIA